MAKFLVYLHGLLADLRGFHKSLAVIARDGLADEYNHARASLERVLDRLPWGAPDLLADEADRVFPMGVRQAVEKEVFPLQGASDRRAHGPAPENNNRDIKQTRGSGVLAPPMHPARVGPLDTTSNGRIGAEIAAEQDGSRYAARSKSL